MGGLCKESNSVHVSTERSFVLGSGLVPGLELKEEQVCESGYRKCTHTTMHMPGGGSATVDRADPVEYLWSSVSGFC